MKALSLFALIVIRNMENKIIPTLFLVLSIFIAPSVWAAGFNNPNIKETSAYTALMEGKTDKARELLASESDDPSKLFLLSCAELSDGNLGAATKYSQMLIKLDGASPTAKVLTELIAERRAYPKEGWAKSFATAWKAAGSPELHFLGEFILTGKWDTAEDERQQRKLFNASKGTPNELLAIYGISNAEIADMAFRAASPGTPSTIKLLAFVWLNPDMHIIPEGLRGKAANRRRKLIQELSNEYPSDMEFAGTQVLEGSSKKELSPENIDSLERVVSKPNQSPSRGYLYNDYLKRYIALNCDDPYSSASDMAMMASSYNSFIYELNDKVKITSKTASLETKDRLASILKKVGRAGIRQGTITDLYIGWDMLIKAAGIRGEKEHENMLRSEYKTFVKKITGDKILYTVESSRLWPIRPLMIDSENLTNGNEVKFYELFTDMKLPADLQAILAKSKH